MGWTWLAPEVQQTNILRKPYHTLVADSQPQQLTLAAFSALNIAGDTHPKPSRQHTLITPSLA